MSSASPRSRPALCKAPHEGLGETLCSDGHFSRWASQRKAMLEVSELPQFQRLAGFSPQHL